MNLIFLFAARFNLRSTISLLSAIVILLVYYIQEQTAIRLGSIMPVTTRSQSQLLTKSVSGSSKVLSLSTSSIIESLGATNLSTNSAKDSLIVTSTSKQLSLEFNSHITTSSSSFPPPAPNIGITSTQHPTVEFQNFNFENTEFQTVNTPLSINNCISNCHNFSNTVNDIMESDCEDNEHKGSPTMMDLTNLITSLSQQISNQSNFIQDQLLKQQSIIEHQANNDLKLQNVIQANENFKYEVKVELENLRTSLLSQKIPSTTSPPTSIPCAQPAPPVISVSQAQGSLDTNQQVMLMLAESFSKLSSIVTQDKGNDTKYDWPKFSGDTKTFKAWYLAILAQLSLPQWQDLYDPLTKDIVKNTTNAALNGKLYAKLITCLDGSALQSIVARTHLHSNGISVLQDLYQTHRPLHIPEIIAAKTVQFWGNMKRLPSESVDTYYNRFKELFDEIQDAEGNIPVKNAVRHFIFTLGSEFEPIQNNYRLDNLPAKWQTEDWPTILVLCRNFYHSVKPQGVPTQVSKNNFTMHNVDRISHQKKVKEWFLFPTKYCKEIASEQKKYSNKCIYHLSDTHQTADCHIKKECEKLSGDQKPKSTTSSQPGSQHGQLRHITEDQFMDAESGDIPVVDESNGNDTNEESLLYFTRLSNHYLRLVKASPSLLTADRHNMLFPVIADSGANYHMFRDKEFFETMSPASGVVLLGDGKTRLSIKGVGTVKCRIGDHLLTIPNVRFIPELSESIYSLFIHIKTPNHGLESSFDQGLILHFPDFSIPALIGHDDIYLDMQPLSQSPTVFPPTLDSPNISTFCRKLSTFNETVEHETKLLDNILHDLRKFYASVKTKRQLGLNVPAGFRRESLHKKQFQVHSPPRKSSTITSTVLDNTSSILLPNSSLCSMTENNMITNNDDISDGISPDFSSTELTQNSPLDTNQSFHLPVVPHVRSVDKVSSSLPKKVHMNEDYLRACVGFRRIDTIKRFLGDLYQSTVTLDNTPADAVLDQGNFASLKKKPRNTFPVTRPQNFGDVMHIDIIFGPEVAVGNIHYGLLIVDRFSRMTYLQPLHNLTTDIQKQLEAFFAHIGFIPRRLISDFDLKLIGGRARDYLNSMLIHMNAAPPHRQDKNGLAERHWQTLVSMSRNWLASAELPSTFWYYAV